MNHGDKISVDDCLIGHKLLKHNNIVINREQYTGQNLNYNKQAVNMLL